jgi:hypothetical protein
MAGFRRFCGSVQIRFFLSGGSAARVRCEFKPVKTNANYHLTRLKSWTFLARIAAGKGQRSVADETADKCGRYVKADIDRLNNVAVKMIRQEEAERRSKTEHLRALRFARSYQGTDKGE